MLFKRFFVTCFCFCFFSGGRRVRVVAVAQLCRATCSYFHVHVCLGHGEGLDTALSSHSVSTIIPVIQW